MKYILFLNYLFIFQVYFLFGQSNHCHQNEYLQKSLLNTPTLADQIENFREKASQLKTQMDDEIFIIPVVVHVIYNNALEDIDDARIFAQINILNEDYRLLNEDAIEIPGAFLSSASDTKIEFCLASLDPNGDTTTGINRVFTANTSFTVGSEVKKTEDGGYDPWDPDTYLNIWICDLPDEVLGFSSYPGFPKEEDGVVINYRYFGLGAGALAPYNLGRTCTHEIGHYFGLKHVWGDDGGLCTGDDGIGDTPKQESETYGCPDFPVLDDCSPEIPGIMFMNYMDYTDDACMFMFTELQKVVMRSTLQTVRSSLLVSPAGCNDIEPTPGEIAEILVSPNPGENGSTITVQNFEGTEMRISFYTIIGQHIQTKYVEPSNFIVEYFSFQTMPQGYYIVEVFNGLYTLTKQFFIY